MRQHLQSPEQAAFDPEVTAAMASAFDRVCLTINGRTQPELIREIIAKEILALAQHGNVNPDTLYQAAMRALGFER